MPKWTTHDDWLLVQAVQQTSDLAIVRHSVKFSTPRTTSEIGRRWRRLLLDEDTCAAASQRLQQDDFARPAAVLPAELAASNLPWSDAELAFIVASPVRKKPKGAAPKYTAQEAETILSAGRTVFHPCRTPASLIGLLSRFWFFEHQAELSLATDVEKFPPKLQVALKRVGRQAAAAGEHMPSLEPINKSGPLIKASCDSSSSMTTASQALLNYSMVLNAHDFNPDADVDVGTECEELMEPPTQEPSLTQPPTAEEDSALQRTAFLRRRRQLLQIESEIASDRYFEFGKRTLAVLRGEFARFEIRSKEVLIGRKTDAANIDIDLAKAGPISRVSRRQAILRLEPDCRFHLLNIGVRPIYICGEPVLTSCNSALRDGDLIEIGGLPFIFNSNNWLLGKARKHVLGTS